MNDPADWSIDHVIKEICQPQLPDWATGTNLKPIINPEAVAKAFKDNDIDGDNLLALEIRDLQNDLGITSFGQRRGLSNVINYLRSKSSKYHEQASRSNLFALATPHMSHTSVASYARSPSLAGFGFRPSIEHTENSERPYIADAIESDHVQSSVIPRKRQYEEVDHNIQASDDHAVNSRSIPGIRPQQSTSDWVQNTSSQLAESNPSFLNALDSVIDQELNIDKHASSLDSATNIVKNVSSEKQDKLKKIPKRATLIPVIDRASVAGPLLNEDCVNVEPSTKRVKLGRTISEGNQNFSALRATQSTVSRLRHRRADQCQRATPKKLSADNDRDNTSAASSFFICGSNTKVSPIKHAARNIKPLSELGCHSNLEQLETQAIASIEKPKLTPDQDYIPSEILLDTSNADLPQNLLSILAKYPVHEDSKALPLYGESDEEDRWTLASESSSPEPESTKGVLCKEEVDQVINMCLKEYKADWSARHLTKTQVKAHRKWMTAAKNHLLHRDILNNCKVLKDKFSKRISELRGGIHVSQWRKAEEVKQQCLAIQVTAHQLEEYSLYVSVLECEEEPDVPPQTVLKQTRQLRKRQVDENGEEELDSDSDTSFIGVEDEVNDTFITDPDIGNNGSSTWSPKFAEVSQSANQKHHVDFTAQSEDHDMIIDSIEDSNGMRIHDQDVQTASRPQAETHETRPAIDTVHNRLSRESGLLNASDNDSDFDREARLPHSRHGKSGKSRDKPIDLTELSPTPTPAFIRASSVMSDLSIRTPKLNASELPSNPQRNTSSPRPDPKADFQSRKKPIIPVCMDVKRVLDMDWEDIEPEDEDELPDSRLALAKSVYDLSKTNARLLLDYVMSFRSINDFQEVLEDGLEAVKEEDDGLLNVDQKNQASAQYMTDCFISFSTGYRVDFDFECSEKMVDDAYEVLKKNVKSFRKLLVKLLERLIAYSESAPLPADVTNSNDTAPRKPGVFKKRKNLAQEKDVLNQQLRDRKRVEEQEKKRALMLSQRSQQGAGEDQNLISINVNEPIVYLDPILSRRVKPHQIDGIRFMWREIIENPSGQGCLLAHTMGLGKTLQVIALLASITQCNKSDDAKMKQHIPDHLQRLRVLILCPASLVQNWYEELSTWLPDPLMLGVLIKVDADVRQPEVTIKHWFDGGGVLICGYERFRIYVLTTDAANIEQGVLQERIRHLTEGPDIVIADEAHKFKSADSKANRAANKIRTKSRIALTGSPLNNHIEEYHTMFEWIAPGYLGNITRFRTRYIDPINRGLYSDSTEWERKESMKRLHMFKRTIAPKVSRADVSVLAKDLPPKTEFFLTITLTKEQKEAYRIYVNHLKASSNPGKSNSGAARVWSWLHVLSLLLNHPSCFISKLEQQGKQEQASSADVARAESEDDGYDSAVADPSADKVVVDQQPELVSAMSKVMEVFAEARVLLSMDDPSLSHKSMLIKLIVEEAVKLNEKTLIFSKSLPTLDYYESMIKSMGHAYKRVDGQQRKSGKMTSNGTLRQLEVTEFNNSDEYKVFLISTRAGALGLNIQSASRVIIGDFDFNPTWEEQAIGRAYRIGQKKPVFVYRFLMGGTFEELVHNKAVFKTQLFTRVVDEKNVISQAKVKPGEYLFEPKEVEAKNFDECLGKDPQVLDRVLQKVDCVRNIFLTETFYQHDEEELNEQELKVANEELELERLERENPEEYRRRLRGKEILKMQQLGNQRLAMQPNVSQQQPAALSHFFTPVVPSQPSQPGPVFAGSTLSSRPPNPLYSNIPRGLPGTGYGDEYVNPPNFPPYGAFRTRDDLAIPSIQPSVPSFNNYGMSQIGYTLQRGSHHLDTQNKGADDNGAPPLKSVANTTPATSTTNDLINTSSADLAPNNTSHDDSTEEEIDDDQARDASGCRPQ